MRKSNATQAPSACRKTKLRALCVQPTNELIVPHDLAAVARRQGSPGLQVNCITDEPGRAVGQGHVAAAGMVAAEGNFKLSKQMRQVR